MQAFLDEIAVITESHGCTMYGFADLGGLTPGNLAVYDRGISFIMPMHPWIMNQLENGPTDAYSVLYEQVNLRIDALSAELVRALNRAGHQAWGVPASIRSDTKNIRGRFPAQDRGHPGRSGLDRQELSAADQKVRPLDPPGHRFDRRAPDPGQTHRNKPLRELPGLRGFLSGRGAQGRRLDPGPGTGPHPGRLGLRRL